MVYIDFIAAPNNKTKKRRGLNMG